METLEIINRIERGEDSKTQFKRDLTNSTQIAQELVAFSNAKGGLIIVGVENDGQITGLTSNDIDRINQLISNSATENVKPPITPLTEIIQIQNSYVMVVEVQEGINKPYCTNEGIYLTKVGADKRKISQEELQRLFQESHKIYADESSINGSTINDLDIDFFRKFYSKVYGNNPDDEGIPVIKILENLYLAKDQQLNLSGLLLFGSNPQKFRPAFMIKGVSFYGNDPTGTTYRDSEDILGHLSNQYERINSFLERNLKRIQTTNSFNTVGDFEIPKIVLEELLVNALMHRDYFISAPIIVFMFDNRIEIISPGKLPNNLTLENIKHGVSIVRNPLITSFGSKILPYRGVGTGIMRALSLYPNITFENNVEAERFKVIIERP